MYYAPQVRPNRDSNPWPPDQEQYISWPWSASVLTARPSGTSSFTCKQVVLHVLVPLACQQKCISLPRGVIECVSYPIHTYTNKPLRKSGHLHSPGRQPILLLSWCLLCDLQANKEYAHMWHRTVNLYWDLVPLNNRPTRVTLWQADKPYFCSSHAECPFYTTQSLFNPTDPTQRRY